jgi:hypothetical protein
MQTRKASRVDNSVDKQGDRHRTVLINATHKSDQFVSWQIAFLVAH